MSKQRFENVLVEVGPLLSHRKYDSEVRASITPAERLALTITYLRSYWKQPGLSVF